MTMSHVYHTGRVGTCRGGQVISLLGYVAWTTVGLGDDTVPNRRFKFRVRSRKVLHAH